MGTLRWPTTLLALLFAASGSAAQVPVVAEVTNCGHESCLWRATVLADGTLLYKNFVQPPKGGKRQLARQEFKTFRDVLNRERPWEIEGTLGDLRIHGPHRQVRVPWDGRDRAFRLMTTPPGFDRLYRSDTSQLGRALRFCQATYGLLGDAGLPDCVDDDPSAAAQR